jgi:hypothetical protein
MRGFLRFCLTMSLERPAWRDNKAGAYAVVYAMGIGSASRLNDEASQQHGQAEKREHVVVPAALHPPALGTRAYPGNTGFYPYRIKPGLLSSKGERRRIG